MTPVFGGLGMYFRGRVGRVPSRHVWDGCVSACRSGGTQSSSGPGFRFPGKGHSDPEPSDRRNVMRNVPFGVLDDLLVKA